MVREIVTYPNPALRRKSAPVSAINDEVRELLNDMVETMYAAGGIGLAAPQIGINLRVVVIDIGSGSEMEGAGLLKIINPKIVASEGHIEFEEGCLSVPDMRVNIIRNNHICLSYLDENGNQKEMTVEGLLAVAIQHEIDHLEGTLILDHVSRIKRDMYLRKKKKSEEQPTL